MRFSIILIICAFFAPIFAVPIPGGSKPGTNKKKADPNAPKAAANQGDIVIVKSEHFIGHDAGPGSSKRRAHPAIVVHHDPNTHVVHVAPIGHDHPGGVPTILATDLAIPKSDHRDSLVAVGAPKMIHQDHIKPLGKARDGVVAMPHTISSEHFDLLTHHIAAHASTPSESKSEKKEKSEKKAKPEKEEKKEHKSGLERRFDGEGYWRF